VNHREIYINFGLGVQNRLTRSEGNEDNLKYVSEDGHHEAVFDCYGNLVVDPLNMGTYNYFGPRDLKGIPHAIADVLPYMLFANGPSDFATTHRFKALWNAATK